MSMILPMSMRLDRLLPLFNKTILRLGYLYVLPPKPNSCLLYNSSSPHSSKYFLTSVNIASATVFLVPGFGMRAISFATCTASGVSAPRSRYGYRTPSASASRYVVTSLFTNALCPACVFQYARSGKARTKPKAPSNNRRSIFRRREWDSGSR